MEIKDIKFDQELYPRFEPNQAIIQKYSESIEHLPPIKVNQNNVLIDGFHRWKAHLLAEQTEIKSEIIQTKNDIELKRLAYQYNSNHGLQLSDKEKKVYAQQMFGTFDNKELANILSVNESTISRWTTAQAESAKEERNRRIIELYLKAEYTQQMIGEIVGLDRSIITKMVQKLQLQEMHIDNPLLYNIWNLSKQDNDRKHFGAFPELFMENLLHYHSKPLDIIYDPFGGGGTTIDVCKRMLRRYYVSDRKVIPGRENDIKEWDINNGLPDGLPKPDLVFLDPPYWRQAENKYSDSDSDLGNMTLEQFNDSMMNLLGNLKNKKVERIAIVIAPACHHTFKPTYVDHIFDFHTMMKGYEIEMRYVMPYSTEIFRGSQVNAHRDKNLILNTVRDLVIWRRKNG